MYILYIWIYILLYISIHIERMHATTYCSISITNDPQQPMRLCRIKLSGRSRSHLLLFLFFRRFPLWCRLSLGSGRRRVGRCQKRWFLAAYRSGWALFAFVRWEWNGRWDWCLVKYKSWLEFLLDASARQSNSIYYQFWHYIIIHNCYWSNSTSDKFQYL